MNGTLAVRQQQMRERMRKQNRTRQPHRPQQRRPLAGRQSAMRERMRKQNRTRTHRIDNPAYRKRLQQWEREGKPAWIVDPVTGCWNWNHRTDSDGYGRVQWKRTDKRAHQWVYIHERYALAEGVDLHHTCENKRCVNPDHFEPVNDVLHNEFHAELITFDGESLTIAQWGERLGLHPATVGHRLKTLPIDIALTRRRYARSTKKAGVQA